MKMKEGVEMKYLVTFVWGFILSQVTYYLGSALAQSPYNFTNAVVVGVLISCGIVFIQHVFMKPTKTAPQEHQYKKHLPRDAFFILRNYTKLPIVAQVQ